MDKNWPRWILASVKKHFEDNRDGIHLFFEGHDRNTSTLTEYGEFRLDGPYVWHNSRTEFKLKIELNVLVSIKQDEQNVHKLARVTGVFLAAFKPAISVFKYGDQPGDDQTLLGCLNLISEDREPVMVSNFGQISPDDPLEQATVEGHYMMHLSTA